MVSETKSLSKSSKKFDDRMYFPTIACGFFAVMLGMMVLLGWYTKNHVLLQMLPSLVPMQYNSALCFLLSGAGLILARFRRLFFTRLLGLLVGSIGLLTLAEYAFNVNLHIDELLMKYYTTVESIFPGRMAVNTALGFSLMGLLLVTMRKPPGDREKSPKIHVIFQGFIAALLIAFGVLGLWSSLFKVKVFFGVLDWPAMALLVAIGFIILGVGAITYLWNRNHSYFPILLIVVLGTVFSFTSYFSLSSIEEQSSVSGFQYESQDRFSLFKTEIGDDLALVSALWAFYDASQQVERDEFYRFMGGIYRETSEKHSFFWAPWIPNKDLARYEEAAKKEGEPDYQVVESDAQGNIKPTAVRNEYFPLQYVAPVTRRDIPLGFNLGSMPAIAKFMKESRDSGQTVATSRIGVNFRKSSPENVFFVFRPVYQKGIREDNVRWRREHLIGFVGGIFTVGDIVESVLSRLRPSEIDLYLYDKSAPVGERFLYHHSSLSFEETPASQFEEKLVHLRGLRYMNTIDFVDRKWLFLSIPSAEYTAAHRTWLPWVAFFMVLYVSMLLAYYLWGTRQHTAIVEEAVSVRTAELSEANEALQLQIEERRRTEERLREMSEAMGNAVEGISQLDESGRYLYVNKAYAEMMGAPEGEMIGQLWERYIDKDEVEKVRKAGEQMLVKAKVEVEIRSARRDGTYTYKQFVLVRSFDRENRYKGFYCFVKDISERKYRQVLEMKTELITMVSHELRSPLHSMREGICIVLEGLLGGINGEQRDALMTAKRSLDRLVRLVNNILDFRKLEDGVVTYHYEENDLNELMEEVRGLFEPVTQNKNLELRLELDKNLPVIRFDKDRITQVILNLLDNAVKFTESGAVTLTTGRRDGEVVVTVKDTGIGIRGENVEKLFKKFGQIQTEGYRPHGGSGLGLAISKRIIEQHGGRVWVESIYQQGSTFYFTLPVRPPGNVGPA
jgi:PAS domain S-box-containing protein